MSRLKNIFAKLSPQKHETDSTSVTSFEEKCQDLGAFQYDNEGFTISYKDFSTRLQWNDITQLNAYKRDLITIDRIEMEIIVGDDCLTISEDLPGWFQFVCRTKERYPTIPKDWNNDIIQPAFATTFMTIYDKSKLASNG